MEIGERFRELRDAKGLTQDQVADKIGWVKNEVQRVESAIDIKISRLRTALKGIDITLAEFFESRIPEKYSDPTHHDLHEKLQRILDANGEFEVGIRVNINAIHKDVLDRAATKARTAPRRSPSARKRRLA